MSLRLLLFSPGKFLDSGQESRCPPHFLTSLGVRALPAAGGILLGGPSPRKSQAFAFFCSARGRSYRYTLPSRVPAPYIGSLSNFCNSPRFLHSPAFPLHSPHVTSYRVRSLAILAAPGSPQTVQTMFLSLIFRVLSIFSVAFRVSCLCFDI